MDILERSNAIMDGKKLVNNLILHEKVLKRKFY